METIFVSIASYRDTICESTVEHLYKQAEHPELIFVGICQQNNSDEDADCVPKDFKYKQNVRIMRLNHYEAKGPTWARYLCSTLYNNETYYVQIDSHTKFTKNWDKKCKDMIKILKTNGVTKPVLSHYPKTIEEFTEEDNGDVPRMCKSFFNDRGMISFEGANMLKPTEIPFRTPYLAGGFHFSSGAFIKELPYDPNLDYIFVGEEILHSIRFFTHGWDIFTPTSNIVYHEYTRAEKPKVWTDNVYKDDDAFLKIKHILKMDTNGKAVPEYITKNIEKYGLGTARTLEDYYNFAGIDLANKQVTKNFCTDTQEHLDNMNVVSQSKRSKSVIVYKVVIAISVIALLVLIYFTIKKPKYFKK